MGINTILIIGALICFLLKAFAEALGITVKIELLGLGLAFLAASLLF